MGTTEVDRLQILEGVANQLNLGWLYAQSVKNLSLAYQADQVHCARFFFLAAYQAAVDQAIALLDGLLGQPGASLIEDLALAMEGQPAAGLQEIRERASGLRQARAEAMSAYHLNPDKLAAVVATFPGEQVAALEACYRDVQKIVGKAYIAVKGRKLPIHTIEAATQDDVQFLMDLMGGGCA